MNREPLIGLNFYLNTRLKGKDFQVGDETIRKYPVYVTITFEQKSNQAKVLVNGDAIFASLEDDWENDEHISAILEDYSNRINKIIRFEKKIIGAPYSITMLSKRFSLYDLSYEDFLKQVDLFMLLSNKKIISEFSFGRIGFLPGMEYLREKLAQHTLFQILLDKNVSEDFLPRTLTKEDSIQLKSFLGFIYNIILTFIFSASEFNYKKALSWKEILTIFP